MLCVCLMRGYWVGVVLLVAVGVFYLGASYWPVLKRSVPEKPHGTQRVVFLNALIQGPDRAAQSLALLRQNPDVIALVEADTAWVQRMGGIEFGDYPYRVLHKVGLREGRIIYDDHIMLASRWPLERVGHDGTEGDGLALYKVMAPQAFHVFVIHPMAPLFADAVPLRNQFLHELAAMVLPKDTLVVGDFNAVPWDPAMWPLWDNPHLNAYFSWLPTYRPDVPAVPIDHVLSAKGLDVKSIRRWYDGQSDHFGLVIDFKISP